LSVFEATGPGLPARSPSPAPSEAPPSSRAPTGRGLVDLQVAARVASRLAAGGALERSYLLDDLERHMQELAAEAELLVAEETGFTLASRATARVLSRSEWAAKNLGSMITLISPLLEKVEVRLADRPGSGIARAAYRSTLGAQLGAVLGLLSHRVVGQYDALEAHADEVWFVGANVVMMERRFGFVPGDFRLWVAVHELTHRAQFLGSPWLREHFLTSVEKLVGSLELEASSILERAVEALRRRDDGIPIRVRLLGADQLEQFNRLQAFMSVLEGHANFVMDRVGEGRIASQPRMQRALRSGTASEGPLAKLLKKVLGLDLKRLQYEEGQRFFETVFAAGGREGVQACFSSAQALPDLEEMRSPQRWLERMGLSLEARP
jgi:coenzyme F420 biosynthesis associated uncharacterized protein